MAWNFKYLPDAVQKTINGYRFDGTPSAKALNVFKIQNNGGGVITVSPITKSAFVHTTFIGITEDACPICENAFEASPRNTNISEVNFCGGCTIRPLKWSLPCNRILLEDWKLQVGRSRLLAREHYWDSEYDSD